MQVRLRVIGGKNNGREIKIAVPEFIIGRGDEAHLKPSSDLVSRRHCAIRLNNSQVEIEDLGSRNGTFVNGQQIAGVYAPKSGDLLRVGQLQFEVVIDYAEPSNKRPKVQGVGQALERTAGNKAASGDELEESVSDWLSSDDDDMSSTGRELRETTMLSADETKRILAEAERKAREKLAAKKRDSGDISDSTERSDSAERPKSGPAKLPFKPRVSHDSSRVAADDVLRKFFNRR